MTITTQLQRPQTARLTFTFDDGTSIDATGADLDELCGFIHGQATYSKIVENLVDAAGYEDIGDLFDSGWQPIVRLLEMVLYHRVDYSPEDWADVRADLAVMSDKLHNIT